MELHLARREPHCAVFAADDAHTPVRTVVLDGRTHTPALSPALAHRVTAGGCAVIITTPFLLETALAALTQAGFCQPRFLKTEDKNPQLPWGAGMDTTTYAVIARHKKGPFVFNERYHTGRLNGQPVNPNPAPIAKLKGAQGAVARRDTWPEGTQERLEYTLSEILSIHTLPGDHAVVDARLFNTLTPPPLTVLLRTRPQKPELSDAAQQRRTERAAKKAQLATQKDKDTPQ